MMPAPLASPRRVFAVAAIFIGHGAGFGAWAATVPRLRELWALRDGPLGVVLLCAGLGGLAAMPLGGVLMARVRASRLAPVAGLAVSLLIAAPAGCHALGLPPVAAWIALLASAVAVGLTVGLTDIAMNAEASAVELRAGRPIMSRLHGGWSLGVFMGGGVASALTWFGLGTAATMAGVGVIEAALMVVGGSLMWRGASEPAAAAVRVRRSALRPLVVLGAMAAICFECEGALADWSGVFLRDVHGLSAASAAAGYSAVALAMMVARFGGDAIRRLTGPVAMTRAGGVVAAGAMALALVTGSAPVAVVAFGVVGLGVANIVPVVISAAGARSGAGGIAAVASLGYAGLLLGPPAIGFAAQALGLPVALWLVVAGAATLAWLAGAVRTRPASGSDLLVAQNLAGGGGVERSGLLG